MQKVVKEQGFGLLGFFHVFICELWILWRGVVCLLVEIHSLGRFTRCDFDG